MRISPLTLPGIMFESERKPIKLNTLRLQTIEFVVCEVFGFTPKEMFDESKTRSRELVKARQTFHYLAKKYTHKSLAMIGVYYNKDHSTVLHSCRSITDIIDTKDRDFHPLVLEAENRLREYINNNYETTNTNGTNSRKPDTRPGKTYQPPNPKRNLRPGKPAFPRTRRGIITPPYFRRHLSIQPAT